MNIIKGILTFLISFTLVILISALTLRNTLEKVQSKLLLEVSKQLVLSNDNNYSSEELQKINKLNELEGANEVISAVLNDYINYVDNNAQISEETIDTIIDFCVNNVTVLEEISGEQLDINEIRSSSARENLRNTLTEAYDNIKVESDSPVKTVVDIYAKLLSNSFRNILLVSIIVLFSLMILVSFSPYKWLRPAGITVLSAGVTVLLNSGLLYFLLVAARQGANMNIDIDLSQLLVYGIIEFIVGVCVLIIFSIIDNNHNKKVNQIAY